MTSSEGSPVLVHLTTVPLSLHFLRGQPAYMESRGLVVKAVSSPGPLLDAFGNDQGIPVFGVPIPRRIAPLEDIVSVIRLVRLLRRLRPTILHAHTPKGGLLGMISARLARVPVAIYTVHGFPYVTAEGRRRRLLQSTERIACHLAHHVLVVSGSVRDLAIADHICDPSKMSIPAYGSANGMEADRTFNPARFSDEMKEDLRASLGVPSQALTVAFIGRLAVDKGVNELAAAWKELRRLHGDIHLVIAGGADERDPADPAIVSLLEEDERVHVLGEIDQLRIVDVYAVADILVLPTYREGFPTVLLEASAMAIPVVATRVSGCVDAVVDGVTGTLVPPRDANSLVDAIDRYVRDSRLRQMHGEAGRRRVLSDFQPETVWESIYRTYDALLRECDTQR